MPEPAATVTDAAPAAAAGSTSAPHMEQFHRLWATRTAGRPGLAEELRAGALAELTALGFPLRRDEEWIHTPLRAVAEARYRLGGAAPALAAPGGGSGLARELVAGEPVILLTCNGAVAAPGVADGVGARRQGSTGSGEAAAQAAIPGVRRAAWDGAVRPVDTFTRPLATVFTRLARAFGDHAVLHCDAAAAGTPLHLVHLVEPGVLAAPRVTISIAAGARVTLVESCLALDAAAPGAAAAATPARAAAAAYGTVAGSAAARSATDHGAASNGAFAGGAGTPGTATRADGAAHGTASLSCADTEIRLGAGALLTYVRVQAVGADAFDFGTTTVVQEQGSELHALSVALGGRIARHTCNVLAAATGTSSRLGGATVAAAGQLLDHHTYLEHAAPGCGSRQLYKTVLGRGGHGVFSGRILVRPVAQQTDAFQLNQNLLLGDARVDSKPQLEIGADDVRCTHGATTGRLNDDQLFYLQARAIPHAAAVRMLARGFLDEVAGDLPDEALRPRLLHLLHRRLDRLVESGT